jgi:hypothetical protein
MSTREEDPAGHFHSAGAIIAGMGLLAGGLFLAALAFDLDFGFIDERGILGIGIAFLLVGLLMNQVPAEDA